MDVPAVSIGSAASADPTVRWGFSPRERSVSQPGGGKRAETDRAVQQEVQRLKAQEEKVKAHEAAHKAAGGQYAGAVSYTYRPGPDGRSYIVGGEVQIDISPGRTPQETIRKMAIVQRAALAPADPSGQDRAVAAQAAAMAAQAQQELARGGEEGDPSAGASESAVSGSGGADAAGSPLRETSRAREGVERYREGDPTGVMSPPLLSVYA